MENHKAFMLEAIRLSEEGMKDGHGGPFGAIVVKDNTIIGRGFNRVLSSNDPTAHAEITAIRDACKNIESFQLNECIIYTSCEPCPMCMGAIYWARPKAVYYANSRTDAADIGFDDDFIYTEIALPLENRKLPMIQLLRSEALQSFKLWKENNAKTLY
jgi:tRNA(Arg) A34 adenosine deaminase TadA